MINITIDNSSTGFDTDVAEKLRGRKVLKQCIQTYALILIILNTFSGIIVCRR